MISHLASYEYVPTKRIPGLWTRITKDIKFSLCVDYFLIKYVDKQDTQYLLDTLKNMYTTSTDWDADAYCGVTLEWIYTKRTCNLSMPGYMEKALQNFKHPCPKRPQHSPYPWTQPQYGKSVQYAEEEDTSEILAQDEVTHIQQVIGIFFYYARAVDHTMITVLGEITTIQTVGRVTRKVAENIIWLLCRYASKCQDTISCQWHGTTYQ